MKLQFATTWVDLDDNKADRKRQTLIFFNYIWNQKKNLKNITKQERAHEQRELAVARVDGGGEMVK